MPCAGPSGSDVPLIVSGTPFPIPTNLRDGVARSDSSEMKVWLSAMPVRVADLAHRWGLKLAQPFQPGGNGSWVAPARDDSGRDAVLKVGWTHTEARDEAERLALFGGEGAAQVYAFEHQGSTTAMLLERCRPGHELRVRPEAEQHQVIAELLLRLWQLPLPTDHRFRPLTTMCDEWADQSAAEHAARPGILDRGLIREGLELFRTLSRTAPRSVLLCTDLHAGNVLAGTRRQWLLIDPKPYCGDPHYDVLQHMLNCADTLQRDPLGLIQTMADLAGLNADRVRLWMFARCVQDSPGWPALAAVARQLAP